MNIDEYKKTEVLIGKTTFIISKLNAVEGFKLLEILRVAIVESGESFKSADNDFMSMCKGVMGLPIPTVQCVQEKLFNHIRFFRERKEKQGTLLPLTPLYYDAAFEGLDPIDVYDLFVRALVVNFFSSFQKLKNKVPQLQSLIQPDQPK